MRLFATALIVWMLALAGRADQVFRNGPVRAQVLELYTSEGCSSCPAADEWVARLATQPGLWTNVVPVAFHVDYWDHLGWRDRFASPAFTERQRTYVRLWRADTMFTPCMVVDGRLWREWRAATAVPTNRIEKTGLLEVVCKATTNAQVRFTPLGTGVWSAHVALLGSGLISKPDRGENEGATLSHTFTALAYTNVALAGSDPPSAEISLPAPSTNAPRPALAVWITKRGSLVPVQAAGGWLTEAP